MRDGSNRWGGGSKEARRKNTDNRLMFRKGGSGRQMTNRKSNTRNSHCSLSVSYVA